MTYTRNPIGNALPFDLATVKDYLRVTHNFEDATISSLAQTAALEIEGYCDLALLDQEITFTTNEWPGCAIALPVGPALSDLTATVAVIEQDGSTTPVTSGFWMEGGRYPVLHFTTTPGGRLRIVYTAGFGTDYTHIPTDLQHAIAAQAVRSYSMRGDEDSPLGGGGGGGGRGLSLANQTIRICARYRKVRA